MKYKLVKTVVDIDGINDLLLQLITNEYLYFCDSILETDDRIIVRYVRRDADSGVKLMIPKCDAIMYIHFSKMTKLYTKICVYESEELINEKDIQKKI